MRTEQKEVIHKTYICDICSGQFDPLTGFQVPVYKKRMRDEGHGYSGYGNGCSEFHGAAFTADICHDCTGKPILSLLDILKEKDMPVRIK